VIGFIITSLAKTAPPTKNKPKHRIEISFFMSITLLYGNGLRQKAVYKPTLVPE